MLEVLQAIEGERVNGYFGDESVVQPYWSASPYPLLNMEQFNSALFFVIGKSLGVLSRGFASGDQDATVKVENGSKGMYETIRKNCEECGLRVSAGLIADFISDLNEQNIVITRGYLSGKLNNIADTIKIEMDQLSFMRIPTDQAEFYNQKELFGKLVNTKFPSIQYDMVEAGNCYAASRSTAVVFHLMRIMERGVQEFGKKLAVTLVHEKNWQNILDEINKAIKALPKSPQTVEMAQAAANLYSVKLAWRNEVMHPKDTYTLEEADNLIRQVKIFMEQLAKII